MLDGYVSEKEQIESIRKWWNEHGKLLLLAVGIGLLIGFSWRQWQKLQLQRAENAAVVYQQVLQANSDKQIKTLQGGVAILKQHFSGTPYASLGALLAAKEAVNQKQLPEALTELQWVIDHGAVSRLKEIARINAARVLLAQSKPKEAEAVIKKMDDKSFAPLVSWVKGDIAMQEGNQQSAQKYYQEAKNGLADFPPAATVLAQLSAN
ncbi:MAG: tetratricopeptide repeat protein [Coxiellaceae bacterium]|nr:tetratricopeptide repeat protein [Coxiellaceae bacterium]